MAIHGRLYRTSTWSRFDDSPLALGVPHDETPTAWSLFGRHKDIIIDGHCVTRKVLDNDREDDTMDFHRTAPPTIHSPETHTKLGGSAVNTHSGVSPSGRKLRSPNFINQQLAKSCAANEAIARISLRWKMSVLCSIDLGAGAFAELKRSHPNLSDQVLAARLRELLREGLIVKHEQQNRRCYAITARGKSLLQIIRMLCDWVAQDRSIV